MKTVLEALAEKHPEVQKAVNEENIWNYSIFGPLSMDDEMFINVRITFGKKRAGKTNEYKLDMV